MSFASRVSGCKISGIVGIFEFEVNPTITEKTIMLCVVEYIPYIGALIDQGTSWSVQGEGNMKSMRTRSYLCL